MTATESQMLREIREIPDAVARLLEHSGAAIKRSAEDARALSPAVVATVARGSSDHAATFLKYACEIVLGLPVASIGPSVASIYGAPIRLSGGLCLIISQSGKSPDIVEMARAARAGGALTVALTNDAGSPLAGAVQQVVDLAAGPERSVAATKTFVTSAVAALTLVAEWAADAPLLAAIRALPEALDRAGRVDWAPLADRLAVAESLFTLGRGPGFAMSGEAALKLKETCQIHAENYSSAEVLHGPVSIVGQGFPVLAFAAEDAAETSVVAVADELAAKGAEVFATSTRVRAARSLPAVRTGHPLTDPIALIVSFYAMVEAVARARGIDPDRPRHLSKITETR